MNPNYKISASYKLSNLISLVRKEEAKKRGYANFSTMEYYSTFHGGNHRKAFKEVSAIVAPLVAFQVWLHKE